MGLGFRLISVEVYKRLGFGFILGPLLLVGLTAASDDGRGALQGRGLGPRAGENSPKKWQQQ